MNFLKPILLVLVLVAAASPVYALESDSKQPIYIEANSATFDDKKGESIYIGDVQVTQGSIRMNSDRLVVYLIKRKPSKIVATGDPVRFKQTPEAGKEDIHAKSQKAEYYAAEARLVLIEKAIVWQGANTYSSELIEYDSKNAIVKAGEQSSGSKRVHVTLQPKDEEQEE